MEKSTASSLSNCPVARSLDRIGESWSLLILRDCFAGFSRFDDFQKNLGIAPNMLSRRLNLLVEEGLLERRQYKEKPPRFEYVLTPRGRDIRPVLHSLLAWGNKHFADEGSSMILVNRATGIEADPVLVDRVTGQIIAEGDYVTVAGPAASENMRQRLAGIPQRLEALNAKKPT